MRFRFVGSESHAAQVRINAFGQALDLDEQTAHDCLLGHVGMVTEEEFKSAGFTDDELDYYAEFAAHADAPASFNEKKVKVHAFAARRVVQYARDAAAGRSFVDRKESNPLTPAHAPAPAAKPEVRPPDAPAAESH